MDEILEDLNKNYRDEDGIYYVKIIYQPVYHTQKNCVAINHRSRALKPAIYMGKFYPLIEDVAEYNDISDLIRMGIMLPCKYCHGLAKNNFRFFIDGVFHKVEISNRDLDFLNVVFKNSGKSRDEIYKIYSALDPKAPKSNVTLINKLKKKKLVKTTGRGSGTVRVFLTTLGKMVYYNNVYNIEQSKKEREYL